MSINPNVKRYIRSIKRLKQAYSVTSKTELAEATGVSRMYLQRNHKKIVSYYRSSPGATDDDMKWFDNRSLSYYVESTKDAREALGAIVGYLLKHRYRKLTHIHKVSAIRSAGEDIVKLAVAIKSRKHSEKGTPISANSKAFRNLSKHNKVAWIDSLFIRSGGYYAGHTSKLWKTTEFMDNVLAEAISVFFATIANQNADKARSHSLLMGMEICYTKWATYSSKCCPLTVTPLSIPTNPILRWYIQPMEVSLQAVQQLCLSSMLHIISNSIDFVNGHFIVSLNHTSSTNPAFGRSYNVFTRLRSFERTELGYFNYDISCALQTISLQLIQAKESDYPLLSCYSKDIGFKRALREDISTSLNIPIADVKAKLTAFANGAISGIDKHSHYKDFQTESDLLRRKVLVHTTKNNPKILQQSLKQSKKNLPEDIDWYSATAEDRQSLATAKASVYFFVWTWYERLIRKAMLTVLKDGIEVHDAVYSKMDVSVEIIEAVIFESTGFNIIIDKN